MKISVVLFGLILATLLPSAYGTNIRVVAEGVFSDYVDPDGLLPFAEPAPGTLFRLEFTYDDSTAPSGPQTTALYFSTISEISLMIGALKLPALASNFIAVADGGGTAGSDFWLAFNQTSTPEIDGCTPPACSTIEEKFFLSLVDSTGTALSSTKLVAPAWPDGWDYGQIKYQIERETPPPDRQEITLASASATITSITATVVPVPAALWSFLSTLGVLGFIRARRV